MPTLALLALFAWCPQAQLLPQAPEGWRFERIDFPLSFAPELDYEGFEELRFAPGMFEAESDSYFSYALAIKFEEKVDGDEAFFQDFLMDYYVGLCRAVGESRKLDLDLDSIKVHVEPGAHGYEARIDMFDAFVTGKEITLFLELTVSASKEGFEFLGLASPKSKTEKIWAELRKLGSEWRKERPPLAFLNHLYYIPDAETYAKIVDSAFLNQGFAVFEQRTTVRPDRTYTGRYFYGRNTYFEFLKPEPDKGFVPGNTGIAFGFEDAGATNVIAAGLKEKGIQTFAGPMERKLGEKQLPWFQIMGIQRATTSSRLDLFSMEYDPRFLEEWHKDLPPEGGIDRASILSRYAAHLGGKHDDVLFQDVIEIHVRLPEKDRERLIEACESFGYGVRKSAKELICEGPGYRIRVRDSDTPGGISAFVVKLSKPLPRRRIEIGAIVVEVEGARAAFHLPVK